MWKLPDTDFLVVLITAARYKGNNDIIGIIFTRLLFRDKNVIMSQAWVKSSQATKLLIS